MAWDNYSFLSEPLPFFLTLTAIILLAYWARRPVHELVRTLADVWYLLFRSAARALIRLHGQLRQRNRAVILELGQQRLESRLEGELATLAMILAREWDAHPAMHRKLEEQLEAVAKDYRDTAQTAPQPPPWISTLDALLRSAGRDQVVVAEIAQAMHATLERSQAQVVTAYKNATRKRHRMLTAVVTRLRRLDVSAQRLERKVADVESRIAGLTRSLEGFRDIVAGRDIAARSLATSFGVQFIVATLVLSVAGLVAYVSFNLILNSLAQLVGTEASVGSLSTAGLAAFCMVALQIVAGLIASESFGVTRLLGTLHRMEPATKQRIAWASVAVIVTLAGIQAAFAYMSHPRDALAISEPSYAPWVHLVLGFVLALVLAATSIALDALFYAGRAVAGLLLDPVLWALATAMFLAAQLGRGVGRMFRSAYDVAIFLPLAVERWWQAKREQPTLFSKSPPAQPQGAGVVDGLDFSSFQWGDESRSASNNTSPRGGNSLPPPPLQ